MVAAGSVPAGCGGGTQDEPEPASTNGLRALGDCVLHGDTWGQLTDFISVVNSRHCSTFSMARC